MCLIHFLPGLCRSLLVNTSGGVGIAVKSFESRNESACTDVHCSGISIEIIGRDELLQMPYDGVWDIWVFKGVHGHFLC